MMRLGCVGLGYWGPNILRTFWTLKGCEVKWACEKDEGRLKKVASAYPHLSLTSHYEDLLGDEGLDAIAIATPATQHFPMVKAALEAGKHVFVEKPLAVEKKEARELIELAQAKGKTLMVGHLLLYHPAVKRLKDLIQVGELGQIYYIYSTRVNLGQVRREENALLSFAPHDISVILYLLDARPVEVSAIGQGYLQREVEDVVFLTLRFPDGALAHCHVSWLDPHKIRKFTVVGSKKMAVFDDMESSEKIRIYDKGVDHHFDFSSFADFLSLRFGDIQIPRIEMREPLLLECQHFLECIEGGKRPLSDGENGLAVLEVIEAAERSLKEKGRPTPIDWK
ncbi:MAG: Gfo/Idh/MocA family oxidoreductase [bacterium]